jgi:hypothetical protein
MIVAGGNMSIFRGISKRVNPLPLISLGRYNADEIFDRIVLVTDMYFNHLIIKNIWNQTTMGAININHISGFYTMIFIKATLKNLVEKRGTAFAAGDRLTENAIREILRWKGPTRIPAWLLAAINSSLEDDKLLDSVYSRYLSVAPNFRDLYGQAPEHEDYDENVDGPPPKRRRQIGGGYMEQRDNAGGRASEVVFIIVE